MPDFRMPKGEYENTIVGNFCKAMSLRLKEIVVPGCSMNRSNVFGQTGNTKTLLNYLDLACRQVDILVVPWKIRDHLESRGVLGKFPKIRCMPKCVRNPSIKDLVK